MTSSLAPWSAGMMSKAKPPRNRDRANHLTVQVREKGRFGGWTVQDDLACGGDAVQGGGDAVGWSVQLGQGAAEAEGQAGLGVYGGGEDGVFDGDGKRAEGGNHRAAGGGLGGVGEGEASPRVDVDEFRDGHQRQQSGPDVEGIGVALIHRIARCGVVVFGGDAVCAPVLEEQI